MNDPSTTLAPNGLRDPRRIVVVGPCASGKSTLVAALRAKGYDARVSGQEHSAIAALWQMSHPDVLIALDATIGAVRSRRGDGWPEWLHDVQLSRLRQAIEAADIAIDTSHLGPDDVTNQVIAYLESGRAASRSN